MMMVTAPAGTASTTVLTRYRKKGSPRNPVGDNQGSVKSRIVLYRSLKEWISVLVYLETRASPAISSDEIAEKLTARTRILLILPIIRRCLFKIAGGKGHGRIL